MTRKGSHGRPEGMLGNELEGSVGELAQALTGWLPIPSSVKSEEGHSESRRYPFQL